MSKAFISNVWKKQYGDFLAVEHLETLAKQLKQRSVEENSRGYPPPFFDQEITPPKTEALAIFQPLLTQKKSAPPIKWANTIEEAPFEYLLILLGQRWTSTTIKTAAGIPPLKKTLLESCLLPYNDQISQGTRAWEKHIGRSTDAFWGVVEGNAAEKEQKVQRLITQLLEETTWWNTFEHYKHGLVFEIRVASGHGLRWKAGGSQLIGFLEPFL